MKKLIALLLVLANLGVLTACNKKDAGETKSDNKATETLDGNSKENLKKIDASTITYAFGYSEGLMFVQINNANDKIYCINKKGEQVFSVDGYYYDTIGFCNGIAVLYGEHEMFLCDTKGNITTVEDVGGTKFLIDKARDTYEMFKDGYILVQKTETDYTGAVEKIGVINSKLEIVTDYSAELYDRYQSHYIYGEYYDGYLYDYSYRSTSGTYLDLRTGKESDNLSEMFDKMDVKFESDMWEHCSHFDHEMYDIRTGDNFYDDHKVVVDLSEYDNAGVYNFSKGTAPVVFDVHSDVGIKYYFTILKEDGSFSFEPIEVKYSSGLSNIQGEGGIYVFEAYDTSSTKVTIYSFDINGKIAEVTTEMGIGFNVTYSDGVIVLNGDDHLTIYNTDFTPLF